jgi:hypothetical protein
VSRSGAVQITNNMKGMKSITAAIILAAFSAFSADTNLPTVLTTLGEPKAGVKGSYLSDISVSPYGTVAFDRFDGKARTGAGAELSIGASRTVSLVVFGESDNVDHFFDRAGLGLRVTGSLGPRFHPFAGLLGGYVFDSVSTEASEPWFLRRQFGLGIDLVRYEGWLVQLKASWGLDVTTDGNSQQRLTGFLTLGKSF